MIHAVDLKKWVHLPTHETVVKLENATVFNKKFWVIMGFTAFIGAMIILMVWAIQNGYAPSGSRTFYPYAPMM